MKTIKVFIASESSYISSRENEKAKQLAKILDAMKNKIVEKGWDSEVKITPWWEDSNFTKDGNVLNSVKKIAHEYDIGVFIFGEDQELRDQKEGNTVYVPNSNVLIELGMFKVLDKKVCIIKDKAVNLPSDINNENNSLFGLPEMCANGLVNTIQMIKDENITSKIYDKACVYYDIELSKKIVNFSNSKKEIKEWETKSLYVGSKSAFLWGEIESSSNYPEANVIQAFKQQFGEVIAELPIDNVVSFGPGIGKIDQELMLLMPECFYIPVDLNVSLAIQSIKNVEANVRGVPFAIIDDFEMDSCFSRLKTFIESKRQEIGNNNLFSMLGVTFSNLSKSDDTILRKMRRLMRDSDDYFLLDTIIYIEKENEELKTRIKQQLSDENYLNLLRNTINKKQINKNPGQLEDLTVDKLSIEILDKKKSRKYTSISETKVVCVKYEGNILLVAKQYKYKKILDYLLKYFEIVECYKDEESRRGVFLLKKNINVQNEKIMNNKTNQKHLNNGKVQSHIMYRRKY